VTLALTSAFVKCGFAHRVKLEERNQKKWSSFFARCNYL